MKLAEKEFIKADGTVIKLTPEWISTKLGEVYELSHLDKIGQERLHYGYMTEALVSFLETTDEKGVPFFERVELKSIDVGNNRISNLLNQRVILDKPSKIERENFYHDFKLWPTTYSDEKKIDDIVVKVHSEFTLCNREGDLELYFNDNLVELNVFELINSYDKKEIYNFNFEDNVASSVIISEMNQPFWSNNKALDNIDVAFEAKKEASIVLESSAINMMINDRENFTFNPIKVGDYFALIDSQINFDRESLKNREVELDTDFFYLKNSSISFEGANKEKVGLYTRGATTLDDYEITCVDYSFINKTISTQVIGGEAQKTKIKLENAVISGDNNIERSLGIKTDNSCVKNDSLTIENIYSKNNLYYEKDQGNDKISAIVAKTTFDNGGYPIYLVGDVSIYDTNIKNEKREGKNSLTIKDCFFVSCDFYNISNMNNARVNNARLENFTLENENESDRNSFYFGLSDPLSIIKIENHPFEISNSTVSLGEDDVFHFYPDDGKKEIKINNSSFTGKFEWVNKKYSDAQKLEIIISNSIFNRANVLHNNIDGDIKIEISASEINGLLACDNLERISNSFIQDSTIAHNIQVVEDCFLKDYEAPANIKTLIGFNSGKSEHKNEIQPINDKMLEEPNLL
jgi:hypothetical protein